MNSVAVKPISAGGPQEPLDWIEKIDWLAVKAKVATGRYVAAPGCDSCFYADFETERICTHPDTTDEEIDAACYDALPCRFYQHIRVGNKVG